MTIRLASALWLVIVGAAEALAGDPPANKKYPQQILLIRHAEKPLDKPLDPALKPDVRLSDQGMARAKKLHELFERKKPEPFPMPHFVFATHNSSKSHRPKETVKYFAEKYRLPINDAYHNNTILDLKGADPAKSADKDKGIVALAHEIFSNDRYFGKTLLICWHHGTMPELAAQLKATGYPKKWDVDKANHPEGVFDRVWVITFDDTGKTKFSDRPQRLMPGDSSK